MAAVFGLMMTLGKNWCISRSEREWSFFGEKKTLNVISTYNNLAAINTTYTDLPRLASGEFLLLFDALPA